MKAYELLNQIKDLCLYSSTGTSRDNMILQRLNIVQTNLYNSPRFWRALEGYQDLYTTELMTLDVAPATGWAVGDTITGQASQKTCVIVNILTPTTYNVKSRSGTFTLGEILSNGTVTADQGVAHPTFSWNAFTPIPSDVGTIFDLRQVSTTPYLKLTYLNPQAFHDRVPQPTQFASSAPTNYTWWGNRIWWYPIPDATYTITMYYYKKPTDMKIYTTGTAVATADAVAGTLTKFSDNANVDTNMHFANIGDILSNGSYPWAAISAVTSNTVLALSAAYTGASSSTTFACSSASTFPTEFDSYLIYAATLLEIGRLREMSDLRGWLKEQLDTILPGLIRNQTYIPDYTAEMQNFQQQPLALGDDYAKYPFISGR